MIQSSGRDCHVAPIDKPLDPGALESAATALLGVLGMGCPNCAMRVRNALLSETGVLAVEVELRSGLARVAYDPERLSERALLDAVVGAGDDRHCYQAMLM